MLFDPDSKLFRAMGRGWAEGFTNDPARWDIFIEAIEKETT